MTYRETGKPIRNDFGAAGGAWAQFGQGGIAHFVIINGVKGGSHKQWEVLHSAPEFSFADHPKSTTEVITGSAPPYGTNNKKGQTRMALT